MKRQINISLICALFSAALFSACDDGSSAPEEPVDTFDAAVVCPAEGTNAYGEPNRGTFTDARDGQVYKYTTIGNQVWMAENLKFDAPYSLCYGKIEGFCDTFGRFYSLHEDGEYQGLFDQELLDTICPKGWHVPSVEEWTQLAESMGGLEKAASRLYSSDSFGPRYLPGSNDCDFSSLPAGYWLMNGNLSFEYELSLYWTSVARSMIYSYSCVLDLDGFNFGKNHPKMTIRCLKD
ncbi:FISUMP domain-containing protein [Fibrobacter sp.]|uniref:FISUMP domain-containing protein n=1 Tax=Fibrobacter sp. TaxID=35828 RepID=UPI00388F08DA